MQRAASPILALSFALFTSLPPQCVYSSLPLSFTVFLFFVCLCELKVPGSFQKYLSFALLFHPCAFMHQPYTCIYTLTCSHTRMFSSIVSPETVAVCPLLRWPVGQLTSPTRILLAFFWDCSVLKCQISWQLL